MGYSIILSSFLQSCGKIFLVLFSSQLNVYRTEFIASSQDASKKSVQYSRAIRSASFQAIELNSTELQGESTVRTGKLSCVHFVHI